MRIEKFSITGCRSQDPEDYVEIGLLRLMRLDWKDEVDEIGLD